jgi:pilus assembly protein Flp/PilA
MPYLFLISLAHNRGVDQDRKEDGMIAIRTTLRRLRSDERGATAIEYGLIAALIAVAIVSSLSTLGGGTNGMWGKTSARLSDVM